MLAGVACLVLAAAVSAPSVAGSAGTASGQPAAPTASDPELDRLLAESQRAYESSNPARGFALLTQAHDVAVKGGLPGYEAEALRRLAMADVYAGRRDAAVEKLTRGRGLFAQLGHRLGEARASLQLARLSGHSPDSALPLARHAWQVFRVLDDAPGMIESAAYLVYRLDPGPEKTEIREAALDAAARVPGRRLECPVLHQWADEQFTEGRLAPAHGLLTRTLACWARTNDRAAEGRAFVSMGRLHRAHGRLADALEWHRRALALQEQHPDPTDPLAAVQSMNAIGVTLQHMGRSSDALAWFEKGLERARAVGPPSVQAFMRAAVASAYLGLGRNQEAATLLEAALGAEAHPSHVAIGHSHLSLAFLRLGQLDAALDHANRAVAASDPHGPDVMLLARENRAAVLVALKRFADAEADLRTLVGIVERMRAETVPSDLMKRGFHDWHQRVFAGYIDLLGKQGRARESLEMAERARARAFLDLLAARAADPGRAEPATADDLQRAARRLRSTIVSYWVGADTVSIWVVPPAGEVALTRVAVPAGRLAELVQQASGLAGEREAPGGLLVTDRAQRAPWRALDRLLVAPIAARLPARSGARLTIVPHGPLFGLSFAGLRNARGQYLLERYELHYAPAGAVLARPARPGGRPARALIVGDPGAIAVAPGDEPLPALPWARREARAARRFLGRDATVLVGEEVTETRVREAIARRSVLHFATHGIVHNEERLASYLALRPAGETDGRLTADEVYGLSLDSDLVVLSGCRTALGPIGGDGVIGFTRAFLTAGAQTVVATQWDVSDRASYEVMQEFYRRRAAGAGTSRSLRGAQLAVLAALRRGSLLDDGRPLPETPRLWAGFVVVGVP